MARAFHIVIINVVWQVGFCNLIKRANDVENDMWVCEAMENSDYFLNADPACPSHLKTSSGHIQIWANLSFSKSVRSLSIIYYIIFYQMHRRFGFSHSSNSCSCFFFLFLISDHRPTSAESSIYCRCLLIISCTRRIAYIYHIFWDS